MKSGQALLSHGRVSLDLGSETTFVSLCFEPTVPDRNSPTATGRPVACTAG